MEEIDIFKVLGDKVIRKWSGRVKGSDKLQLLIKSQKECKLMWYFIMSFN